MRLHPKHSKHSRAGLTLVEMLIALALSIFIMAIMSEAFIKGLEAFGNFKALADLEQRLRTVANIIRRDLKAPHFDNSKKLSECTASGRAMPVLDGLRAGLYLNTVPADVDAVKALLRQLAPYRFKTPTEGFFSVEEWPNRPAGATMFFEGQDASGRPSYRDLPVFNPGGNIIIPSDTLHFTSRLEGNDPDKFFYGKVRTGSLATDLDSAGLMSGSTRYDSPGNGMYTSQAAEMLYFMGADGSQFIPGVTTPGGPVLTFNLYRQAWLLVPNRFSDGTYVAGDASYSATPALYAVENDVSAVNSGGTFYFNSMADVQHRVRRTNSGGIRAPKLLANLVDLDGSDILLTNVISFDVKVFDPFAYKIPLGAIGGGPASGRGAYVDIGDVLNGAVNPFPTAAGDATDVLQPVFGGPLNATSPPYVNPLITDPLWPTGYPIQDRFDTGTNRYEGVPTAAGTPATALSPLQSPSTHPFPFTSIQITIRVYEPKSKQTRQITIIQDM